jgi:hypothetical protein
MVDGHEVSGGVVHDLPADLTAALKRDAEALTSAKASAVPAADKAHSCKALIACCTTEVA